MSLSTSPNSNSDLQSLKLPMIVHFTTMQVLMANPFAVNGSTSAYVTHFTPPPPPAVMLAASICVTDNLAVWCGAERTKWLCISCDASALAASLVSALVTTFWAPLGGLPTSLPLMPTTRYR